METETPIGAGSIDHQKAFKALKNINYDSYM